MDYGIYGIDWIFYNGEVVILYQDPGDFTGATPDNGEGR